MKIGGKAINRPQNEVTVIPRSDGDIVFEAQAVLDFAEFDKICPEPKPPIKTFPGGRQETDGTDLGYLKKQSVWAEHRSNWIIIESLRATPGLEWETVDYTKPETWGNFRSELEKVFTAGELNAIISCVMKANSLDEARFDEARKTFLAQKQQA